MNVVHQINLVLRIFWRTSSNHWLITALLLFTFTVSGLDAFSCIGDKCDCKHISGKKYASCVAQDIHRLPECYGAKSDEKAKLLEIQILNLTQNQINELSANFFSSACLENLQKIFIQQVGLTRIDKDAFYPLKNVIELSLSSNMLANIPTGAMHSFGLLRILDMSHNRIKEIGNNSFVPFRNLQTLSLEQNEISFIDVDAFKGLNLLRSLKLSYNRLTFLKPETFIPLISLHSIYLEGNMWNCNCRMQPFKRMLLLRSMLNVLDQPRCISNHSAVWSNLALENFQCPPQIMKNFSEPEVTVSEGSPLRLKCAIVIETFGDQRLDEEYLALSSIEWYWNQVLITNNSKGCENCKNFSPDDNGKHFVIQEYVREYNRNHKLKISNLELNSVMALNEGSYRCKVINSAGIDEFLIATHVIPYFNHNKLFDPPSSFSSAASSSSNADSQMSYSKNSINHSSDDGDHVLFGLVLGILCGIFIVLVIFSIVLMVFFRRNKVVPPPQELAPVDCISTTDNNTLNDSQDVHTETTTEKLNTSQQEFNPLLMVNPVQKPPRLGIPDVSSIYSNPSWTIDRANYNRSRYASYAETEPLYSDYYTLFRHKRLNSRLDNRTFISDTASEV